MMQHPTIALALGQQRHAAFLAEAERARLARATSALVTASRLATEASATASDAMRRIVPPVTR